MPYVYRPRGMPARFLATAPAAVQRGLLDVIRNPQPAVCEFDVILRPVTDAGEIVGLDFGKHGERGCHFFLKPHEARAYRERSRRRRVAWADLPEPTRKAITEYLAEE